MTGPRIPALRPAAWPTPGLQAPALHTSARRGTARRTPRTRARHLLALAAAALLAGCAALSPPQPTPATPPAQALARAAVPETLPVPAGAPADTAALDWAALVRAPQLQAWVAQALQANRDLRVAALNVERARAALGLADAQRRPVIGAGLNASRTPNGQGEQANSLTAGVQLASWEIDLFGRLASQADAARAQLAASQAGQRAAELSVVAAVLQAGLVLQADAEQLQIARRTVAAREQTLRLTRLREQAGAASLLELQAQEALGAQARATVAQLERQVQQDGNALALLLGRPLAAADWPAAAAGGAVGGAGGNAAGSTAAVSAAATSAGPGLADDAWLAEVPAGLSSQVLLRRPDVLQAESTLRAADASIDAARKAFLPSITLTGQAGQASATLSGLFQGGNFAYQLAAGAALTLFDGGRRQAGVDSAVASQQIALAQYERAIQAAFRETADALAGLATWRTQREALEAQRSAARETARLTRLKAEQGAASTLELLEAERSLFAAEQAVLQARLGELSNRVALYKALGA